MQLAHHNRIVVGSLSIVALGFMALAGCTMVSDHLTGVRLKDENPVSCVKTCNDTFKGLYDQEQQRHIDAIGSCQTLAGGDEKSACLDAETLLHEANMVTLSQGKTDCQNNCHRQGAGSGS